MKLEHKPWQMPVLLPHMVLVRIGENCWPFATFSA
jgi:hypothetical protein